MARFAMLFAPFLALFLAYRSALLPLFFLLISFFNAFASLSMALRSYLDKDLSFLRFCISLYFCFISFFVSFLGFSCFTFFISNSMNYFGRKLSY